MSKYLALLLIGIALAHDKTVDGHDERGCGTTHYMEELLEHDPDWKASLDQFEVDYAIRQERIKNGEIKPVLNSVTIPIVFHIVYRLNQENVADSAIAYQLQVLQQDFAGTNPDYNNVPSPFTSPNDIRAGDFGFTIFNDQTIRKATTVTSFGTNNNIKFDSSGGSSVVQPNSKLNFWSGQLSGGLLGYAQFPGGNPSTDGVVNLWSSLAPSVGNPPYNLGRTATHEIGHWLNLRHIWGDSNSCSINDGVDDTPAQSGPNFGCPSNPNNARLSCPAQNPYPYDLMWNYMDYSEDACLIMFTLGQADRSWQSIYQWRQGFNPTAIKIADIEYVNWLYFIESDHEITNDDDKCYGAISSLFYESNLNENSGSNKYIYGCVQKTKSTNVRHITDITFRYGLNSECPEGYEQASQNLNAGNDKNNPIYMCYLREESNENNNNAVLDITFIRDGNTAKLSNEWEVFLSDNINPDGVQLNLAIKKGKYIINEEDTDDGLLGNNNADKSNVTVGDTIKNNAKYIVGAIVGLIAVLLMAFVVWKFVCSRKGFKEAMQTNNEALIYGATELSEVHSEIK